MTVRLIFNELSVAQTAANVPLARQWMGDVIGAVKAAQRLGVRPEIRTAHSPAEINIAEGYSITRWIIDPANGLEREWRSRLLSGFTKFPYLTGLHEVEEKSLGMDAFIDEQRAPALLATYLLDGLALSVPSADTWKRDTLRIEVIDITSDTYTDDGPGDAEVVRHATDEDHVERHKQWIKDALRLPPPTSWQQMWNERLQRYSHLDFCSAVEDQLRSLNPNGDMLLLIDKKLRKLEENADVWRENGGAWQADSLGGASPESAPTLLQYGNERTFRCSDGTERLFSWHMKLAGGWRIYFFPEPETRTMYVGYIGTHLPTVRFG
jgi:hypothetical protein